MYAIRSYYAEIALVKTFLEQRGGDVGRELEGATLGELTLENDFLESALIKAGMLSAKR